LHEFFRALAIEVPASDADFLDQEKRLGGVLPLKPVPMMHIPSQP
jgi:hypothetical protein